MIAADLHIVRADESFRAWDDLLAMLLRAFAYMNGRIDPPSSVLSLTPEVLKQKAKAETAYVAYIGGSLAGCAFLADRGDHFYLGKLAVEPALQRNGIGKRLLAEIECHALAAATPTIELQTRVELVENRRAFNRLGFIETGRTSHPGFDRPTTITMRKALA